MLTLEHATEGLSGAKYNPRQIGDDALDMLARSIRVLGCVKPIIVTKEGLIIAGHQRVKALNALGVTTVPAYVLEKSIEADEMRFNQLHNSTDLETDSPTSIPPGPCAGFEDVAPQLIDGNLRSQGAPVRAEICKLIAAYGQWGCAVASTSGEILSAAQYALACKALGVPCRVFRIPEDLVEEARLFFGRQYGEFYYGHLERKSWIQSFAQPFRFRSKAMPAKSDTYEKWAIPFLDEDRSRRLLDFGCGQADYVKRLRSEGYRVFGVEFFHRHKQRIDTKAVHAMIDAFCKDLRENGLFDAVVCDFVVNSVDSVQSEADVFNCCAAFCKPGGYVYLAGRAREGYDKMSTATVQGGQARNVEMFDRDGFTGIIHRGEWFYQKWHYEAEVYDLLRRHIGPDPEVHRWTVSQFFTRTQCLVEGDPAELEASIRREFNLPWPEGRTVDRGEQAVEAYRAALRVGVGS